MKQHFDFHKILFFTLQIKKYYSHFKYGENCDVLKDKYLGLGYI